MVLDRLRRRAFLGGAVAALTGLAGCNESGEDTTEATPSATPTDSPTATKTTAEATQEVPPHTHAGSGEGGSRLDPESVTASDVNADTLEAETGAVESEFTAGSVATGSLNGTVYAARMPGEDLSRKVRAGIDALPANGTVIVTPRPDGEPWEWAETLALNLRETGGVTLLFRGMTLIEYTGDGWAIEVSRDPADYGQLPNGNFFRLRGGHWEATGNPDGWLKLTDTNNSTVHPYLVNEFMNEDKTATGIRVVNEDFFCEKNVFSGFLRKCDVGIDFVPAAVSGGSGTDSFQSTFLNNLNVDSFNRYGFRWREDALFQYCTVLEPLSMAGTFGDQASRLAAFDLGGDFSGTVFISPKLEDAGSGREVNDSNDTGYRLRESMGQPPLLLNPNDMDDVDRFVVRDDEDQRLPALKVFGTGRAAIVDLGRPLADPRFEAGGVTFPSQEVFGAGSREPEIAGNVIYFEGVDNKPEGLYRADPENSRWVKVEDNSVTFPD